VYFFFTLLTLRLYATIHRHISVRVHDRIRDDPHSNGNEQPKPGIESEFNAINFGRGNSSVPSFASPRAVL
jgi:hypothetical protein